MRYMNPLEANLWCIHARIVAMSNTEVKRIVESTNDIDKKEVTHSNGKPQSKSSEKQHQTSIPRQ